MKKIKVEILVLYTLASYSCNMISAGDRDRFIGKYKFSIENSDFRNYRALEDTLELLNLEISENDSFYFSQDVPFFEAKTGKVEYRSIDGFAICHLVYYEVDGVKLEEQLGRDENGNLYINNTISKDGAKNISKAFFIKIR